MNRHTTPSASRPRCLTTLIAVLSLVTASAPSPTLYAQSAPAPASVAASSGATPAPSCLDRVPAKRFHRGPVYLQAIVRDSAARAFAPEADLIAQSVADAARVLLGATEDSLPPGEPTITWRTRLHPLTVIAWRDGRLTPVRDTTLAPADTITTALLTRALHAAFPTTGGLVWPAGVTADSIVVHLGWVPSEVEANGHVAYPIMHLGFPVFSLAMLHEDPVRKKHLPTPRYPEKNEAAGVIGWVLMQFVVDTTGTVDPATVRDLWDHDRPRLTGSEAEYYTRFVDAARQSLLAARFEPAVLGGCKVRQLVQMPFGYDMNH